MFRVFVFIHLFFSCSPVFSATCQDLFTAYQVPPGFNQQLYNQSYLAVRQLLGQLNDDLELVSSAKRSNKSHLIALALSSGITAENFGELAHWSSRLPDSEQERFEQIVLFLVPSLTGDVSVVTDYLKKLILYRDYQRWFAVISSLHMVLKNLPFEHSTQFSQELSDSIHDLYALVGISIETRQSEKFEYPSVMNPLAWLSPQSLKRHFKKRTQKDGYQMSTEQDLLDAANQFALSYRPEQIFFARSDGTYAKYDPVTKELVIISSNNKIITYYILSSRYRNPDDLTSYMAYLFLEPPPNNRPQ
jgi:hypothetical protein